MNVIFKSIICLVFSIFLVGCSLFKSEPKKKQDVSVTREAKTGQDKNQVISKDLLAWNKGQKVNLLPHQLLVVDHLEKNPNKKGLLVYHYLGTGKTYLALGFAERHPSKNVVILAPRFLQSHWQKNILSYGVMNPGRYKIVTHANAEGLVNADLSNSIVIIDESHKLINQLHSSDPQISDLYSRLYINLRSAYKILSLTGTPIYSDISDIAYQINMLSDEEVIPFNRTELRRKFTKINQNKAFFRGHLVESQIFRGFLPIGAAAVGVAISPSIAVIGLTSVSAILLPYAIKSAIPVNDMSLRSFDAAKLKAISEEYITYYDFNNEDIKNYPKKNIYYKDVSYNDFQLDFLMRFADGALSSKEIMMLQRDEITKHDSHYLGLHSSQVQETMKNRVGAGREIGNLTYRNADNLNKIIYPEKFVKAFAEMKKSSGPVVIYSHYYHNGLMLFKDYLDTMGERGKYEVLDPELSPEMYEQIISKYNNGQLKYLLIHPEITEGISLKGTNQLHILEPSFNKSAQDQIIGRAVRYMSHAHLAQDKRYVNVYIWKQSFSNLDTSHLLALRRNWTENFSEVNYYSERKMIDKNSDMKMISPDDRAYESMNFLGQGSINMVKLLKQHSIEVKYNNGRK